MPVILLQPLEGELEMLGFEPAGTNWASFPLVIKPARSSTLRCLEMAGRLMSKGSASSVTVASPRARRSRIARRVGSARAGKDRVEILSLHRVVTLSVN